MAENQSNANGSLKKYDEHVPEIKFTKVFINGEFVDSVKGRIQDTRSNCCFLSNSSNNDDNDDNEQS